MIFKGQGTTRGRVTITLSGPQGCGKSLVTKLLAAILPLTPLNEVEIVEQGGALPVSRVKIAKTYNKIAVVLSIQIPLTTRQLDTLRFSKMSKHRVFEIDCYKGQRLTAYHYNESLSQNANDARKWLAQRLMSIGAIPLNSGTSFYRVTQVMRDIAATVVPIR